MPVDELDKAILAALQHDGRASVETVAETIGLTPTPTRRRIRRLEEAGVIAGYSAIVDPAACGLDLLLYVMIKLAQRDRETINGFERAVQNLPEIVNCDLVTGEFDYLMVMHTASMQDYNLYLRNVVAKIPGIVSIQTSVVIGNIKRARSHSR